MLFLFERKVSTPKPTTWRALRLLCSCYRQLASDANVRTWKRAEYQIIVFILYFITSGTHLHVEGSTSSQYYTDRSPKLLSDKDCRDRCFLPRLNTFCSCSSSFHADRAFSRFHKNCTECDSVYSHIDKETTLRARCT